MRNRFLFLITLGAALGALAPTGFAQGVDRISSINDQTYSSNGQLRLFNRVDCGLPAQGTSTGGTGGAGGTGGTGGTGGAGGASGIAPATVLKSRPSETSFEIRLDSSGGSITSVYLWVGTGGADCEQLAQRNETQGICAEIAGNPKQVSTNLLVSGLTLQDLLDAKAGATDIVTCDSSGLTGTPYKIFAFRGTPPSGDVDASQYGVTDFYVDVDPPAPPLVNTSPQEASTFTIQWSNPNPPDNIAVWRIWVAPDVNDPSNATALDGYLDLSARSVTLSASDVGLQEIGQTAYVYMQAYDQTYVSDKEGGNQSELSDGVSVTYVETGGFCDATGSCTGCSAGPMTMAAAGPSAVISVFGLLCALAYRRRRRG